MMSDSQRVKLVSICIEMMDGTKHEAVFDSREAGFRLAIDFLLCGHGQKKITVEGAPIHESTTSPAERAAREQLYEDALRQWEAAGKPMPEGSAKHFPRLFEAGKAAAQKIQKAIEDALAGPKSP